MLSFADARDLVAKPMDETSATAVIDLLMAAALAVDQGAELLIRWQRRGPTGTELAAVVRCLLARAVRPPITRPVFDLCGTGGSGRVRFNVSTTAAFVLAAAGVPVAKHGNKGSARPNGSFDLLDALGIPYQLPPERLAEVHARTGLCFLFARAMHPAVAAVAPYRKAAAAVVPRTIFNLAGPLANPCRPTRQLIGVVDQQTAAVVCDAIAILGTEAALVIRGHPGIDEISITGPTQVWAVGIRAPTEYLIPAARDPDSLPGGDAQENAKLFSDLVAGNGHPDLAGMVAANAGVAIDLWHGRTPDIAGPGVTEAARLIAAGAIAAQVDAYKAAALAG
ncbi:anthranilate phosphoribosyltransferase [Planctomycetota bacterium]|nr:anthranilate phosphoribosyltransferase [Planctomycetota bacterium]